LGDSGRSHGDDAAVVDGDCAVLDNRLIAVDGHDKVSADDEVDALLPWRGKRRRSKNESADCTSSKLFGLEMSFPKRHFLTATYAA
jgi:hypothetical protein